MSKKRYQIFLSSTFSDLKDERRKVMQALLEMDCIPSGMEFFPASDEETLEFIKTIIDESDYYILILGGRYGSVADDGLSYTEKEYDYAKEIGKPVLSFVRQDIEDIKVSQTDNDPDLSVKIKKFRKKVLESGNLAKLWENSDQLAGQVISTLTHAIKRHPQSGWIRGDQQASTELLTEINELRKQNDELRLKVETNKPPVDFENLADLEDEYTIELSVKRSISNSLVDHRITLKFGEILSVIGDKYRTFSNTSGINSLETYIESKNGYYDCNIGQRERVKIITQFEIMGIFRASNLQLKTGGIALFHTLTEHGTAEYLKRMAITKTAKVEEM